MDFIFCISKIDNSGPSKGLIALANGLSKSHSVSIVYFKENGLHPAYTKKSISKLIKVVKYNRKEVNYLVKNSENVKVISMCFLSDFLVPFLFRKCRRFVFIRGNLFQNYWYDYGLKGYFLAAFHYTLCICYHKCLVLNQEEFDRVSKINRNTAIVANCLDEAWIDYKNKII